jgi:hypothetical protein
MVFVAAERVAVWKGVPDDKAGCDVWAQADIKHTTNNHGIRVMMLVRPSLFFKIETLNSD